MKRVTQIKATLAIAVGLFGSIAASAQTINATIAAASPPVFRWVKHASQTFIPAVNKKLEGSGYKIKWSEQYGGSLAKVGEVLEAVEEGLAEVGVIPTLFEPAKLSLQNVTYYTPFLSQDFATVSTLIDKLHDTVPEFRARWEANGLEYLGAAIGIDDYMLMTNFPVNSLEDLKGRKIGASGPAVNWLKGVGAVGVSASIPTYYNELKTGVYDGIIVFPSAALPGKFYEIVPYITVTGFGAQYAGGIAANKDWFDSQPQVVQDALRAGGEAQRIAYQADLKAITKQYLETMVSKGASVTQLNAEDRKKWAMSMENYAKIWADQLDKSGQPGTKVLNIYMNAMRDAGATPLRDWDKE